MTHRTHRHTAESLFRPPTADKGSDAEKLTTLRKRLQLRKRELRLAERHERQQTRTKTGMA